MKPNPLTITILLIMLLLAGGTLGKVHWNAWEELKLAEHFVAENDLEEAVIHFERSLHWYLPWGEVRKRAANGMWAVGEQFEALNNIQQALDTYRLLRGSFYAVRSFYTPGPEWIVRTNEKIATLMARRPPSTTDESQQSFEQRKNEALKSLSVVKSPNEVWSIVTVAGFLGWVTCAFLFIFKAMTRKGNLLPRPAMMWGGGFVLCYGVWFFGMFYV